MAAHYDIFRHHLLMKYPAYGHALWEPDPGNLYPAVKVGDVGYIRQGKFRRLFNALLPAEDESHEDFGVPEYHEPLTLGVRKHIEIGKLCPNNFCSAKVSSMPASERQVNGPDEIPKVTFYCPRKEGAVLSLPVYTKAENTVASADFAKWMISHIDRWFAWARQLGLGVDRMDDIILVTGAHCTRSCTNVAFPGGQDDAQVSFGAKVDRSGDTVAINWQFSHEQSRGVVVNYGPEGKDLPEDQCIFIRGFRATRKLKILPPKLKGAAEPTPDPEGDDEPDVELVPIPALPEYRDPLHLLLEYIAEEAPHCDMVLVHDDDLARLDGICDVTRLDSDVMLSHIRDLRPTLHNARIDLSSARNGASADIESARVATLSNVFEKRSPGSIPSAPHSFHIRMPFPREVRRIKLRFFSVSTISFYVFAFILASAFIFVFVHFIPLPGKGVTVIEPGMSTSCHSQTIAANADIVGIGTRINFYATILLFSLIPETELTSELLDGLYENAIFLGLGLVITAVIQTIQGQLDLYHAIFVMQITFSLDFVYAYGVRKFSRSRNTLRAVFLISIQIFSTAVFTIWFSYVLAQNSRFGSLPDCNHVVKYVLFFASVRATATWLWAFFIVCIVFAACSLLFRFGTIIFHLKTMQSEEQYLGECNEMVHFTRRKSIYKRFLALPVGSAIYGVTTLELIIQRNRPNVGSGESDWGFGQIMSLILILQCFVDGAVVFCRWWRLPRRPNEDDYSAA